MADCPLTSGPKHVLVQLVHFKREVTSDEIFVDLHRPSLALKDGAKRLTPHSNVMAQNARPAGRARHAYPHDVAARLRDLAYRRRLPYNPRLG